MPGQIVSDLTLSSRHPQREVSQKGKYRVLAELTVLAHVVFHFWFVSRDYIQLWEYVAK